MCVLCVADSFESLSGDISAVVSILLREMKGKAQASGGESAQTANTSGFR